MCPPRRRGVDDYVGQETTWGACILHINIPSVLPDAWPVSAGKGGLAGGLGPAGPEQGCEQGRRHHREVPGPQQGLEWAGSATL
jgi:hypothetical protein